MYADDDLREFSSVCRLFPLAGVVLFPHSVLPLHIFEPRYRQMTEDALSSDRLITMAQPRRGLGLCSTDRPALEPVACLGKILNHERLPDGRFNFLLLGVKRVRLVRELESDRLYRLADVEVLEDEPLEAPQEPLRGELVELFRTLTIRQEALDPDLAKLLEMSLSLGALTDIIAHALSLPPEIKQAFLAECCVRRRAEGLIEILRQIARPEAEVVRPSAFRFPPGFSVN